MPCCAACPTQGSLDLSPWLYVLPAELAPFKDLLLAFGATPAFSAQQLVSVLHDMARHSETDGTAGGADVATAATAKGSAGPGAGGRGSGAGAIAVPLQPEQLAQAIAAVQVGGGPTTSCSN